MEGQQAGSATRRAARLPALIGLTASAALAFGATPSGGAGSVEAARAGGSSCPHAHARPAKVSHTQARTAIVCLINRERGRRGLEAVRPEIRLRRAARRHNRRMNGTGCWAHECPGEPSLVGRARDAGYVSAGLRRWMVGENIAWSGHKRATPTRIVKAWMHSPGHRHTLLTAEYRDIGVAFNRGTPSSKRASGVIYTTDFGLRIP